MQIEEEDVLEILLLSFRLANALNLNDESDILRKALNAGDVLSDIIDVWKTAGCSTQIDAAIAGLDLELSYHSQTIHALPDLFENGIVADVYQSVRRQAALHLDRLCSNIYPFPIEPKRA